MENEHLKKGALVFQGFLSLFPAYAGVIPMEGGVCRQMKTFPRIRGGDPEVNSPAKDPGCLFPAYAGVIPGPAPRPG